MSARAPRRSFATPFVLTLAAIPACTVQSAPPPQGPSPTPVAQGDTRDHRDHRDHGDKPRHVNPPGPRPVTQPPPPQQQPDTTPIANPPRPANETPETHPGGRPKPSDVANTTSTTVTQSTADAPVDTPRGYRQWTVTRNGTRCESMVKVHCPAGAMCNPPPPAKYACPKTLEDNGRMDIIQHADKGDCFVDFGEVKCPPNTKCNPPRPQKVACPK